MAPLQNSQRPSCVNCIHNFLMYAFKVLLLLITRLLIFLCLTFPLPSSHGTTEILNCDNTVCHRLFMSPLCFPSPSLIRLLLTSSNVNPIPESQFKNVSCSHFSSQMSGSQQNKQGDILLNRKMRLYLNTSNLQRYEMRVGEPYQGGELPKDGVK